MLGPLLFSIYINGITETSISVNSYRFLYADDVLLYRGIAEPKEDLSKVQSDIDELERWSEEQLLQMNPSKCKYMIVSKKHRINPSEGVLLRFGGTTLGEVESFKYLGVLLHKHLTWSEHISSVCNKARQILGLIYRQLYNNSSPSTMKQLYFFLFITFHIFTDLGYTSSNTKLIHVYTQRR